MRLLVAGDIDPVAVDNPGGSSDILLLGDHAGRLIPGRLGDLGLDPAELERHIAWDIGVAGLGARLAGRLDAVFLRQTYSRLVIDCNRWRGAAGSIPAVSDGAAVMGNAALDAAARRAREAEIFAPYHAAIAAELDRRAERPTLIVSLHSFTPTLDGSARPWRFGVLHRRDSAFSAAVLQALTAASGDDVGDNQPYAMDDTDFTIPHHADARGLDYLELEVRQDLIADAEGQARVADLLAPVLAAGQHEGRAR
ncbi:N-formylglutamate amidohydrolase [Caulobacter sp. DWP3-1-3b2]|uniref:N-formylglutamate amidohydrolase n=1 Tax=Caulobacter sp. DWP3-1-3b2 TaxID=2804643 RepID=UPI003CEA37EA